jgi:RimJ/RimL family protein N-acetyltransferase
MVGGTADPPPWTAADADRWYEALRAELYAWVVEHEGRGIGVTRLHKVDLARREGFYAVGLFRPEHRVRGFCQEVTRLVLDYAFERVRPPL